MNSRLVIRPEALDDLKAAHAWYESELPGLGDIFLKRVDEQMRVIPESPRLFPEVVESVRRAVVRRFPYGIYFQEQDGRIVVLAVFHFKRSPDRLRDRF